MDGGDAQKNQNSGYQKQQQQKIEQFISKLTEDKKKEYEKFLNYESKCDELTKVNLSLANLIFTMGNRKSGKLQATVKT
jgi:hypothetical protein